MIAVEEPMVSRILEHKLRREGHHTLAVHDAASLRTALAEMTFDVLLLHASLRGVRLDPRSSVRAGWLLMTGSFDAPECVEQAMRDGAAGVVRLPFKPTAVAEQVATLLAMAPA